MTVINRLTEQNIIAVLRGFSPDRSLEIGRELVRAGIRSLEITMDSPDAGESIELLSQSIEDALIGAGTVRSSSDLNRASGAGASFFFSPVLQPELIQKATDRGQTLIPGCLTPTEVFRAHEAGAAGVKIFPATPLGPSYVRSVGNPLPDLPIIPTGGIDDTNVADFLRAGAAAVGIGSFLTDKVDQSDPDAPSIFERAKRLREVIEHAEKQKDE